MIRERSKYRADVFDVEQERPEVESETCYLAELYAVLVYQRLEELLLLTRRESF